jgi:NADH-quinone oxidoreductase subunit L
MVTAGVFMVARCSPLFEYAPIALMVVAVVGAFTAFFAATVGLVQTDIKRVIAYSTCSQLGYMFFACGVSAYQAAIFHLFTHAFFKALLFLGAGSVIHAMSDEQDMRKMGGIWRHVKVTYALMWAGSLALVGFPLTAGFFSKDMVLEAAFGAHTQVGLFAFTLGVAAAVMTSFYSFRLLFLTFHGQPRADHHTMEHIHESPWVMLGPLMILAAGALFAGLLFGGWMITPSFIGEGYEAFWGKSILVLVEPSPLEAAHHVPLWVKAAPFVAMVLGLATAWWFYIRDPGQPKQLAKVHREAYLFLLNKWYFDELYELIFVRPAKWLGRLLWRGGDGRIIDGLGPDGIAATVLDLARRATLLQTGFIYHYAFAMLIGVAALVTWFFTRGFGG